EARRPPRNGSAPEPVSHETGMIRLAMNVGGNHKISAGDVVGVIMGVAKIPKESIGAINMLPGQTMVDVSDDHANVVMKKLNGIKFKGRKLAIRVAGEAGRRTFTQPTRLSRNEAVEGAAPERGFSIRAASGNLCR